VANTQTRAIQAAPVAQSTYRDRRRYAGNPGDPLATGDYFVITESEVTGNHVGDAPMLPELLDQVSDDQEIGMVTAPSHACNHALPGSGWCL
jgi:hypothetical protein